MSDRDTFAAAALTGLLAAPTDKDRSMDYWARLSYEAADAMLRERERVTEPMTKEKRAMTREIGPELVARIRHVADSLEDIARGAADSPQPFAAAYAVYLNGEYDSSYGPDAIDEALEIAADCNGEVVPLYRTPQTHATPGDGSVHGESTEPAAWAILHKDHQYVSLLREHAEAHNVYCDAEVVPLYRSPDAERLANARLSAANVALMAERDSLRDSIRRLAAQDATLSACDGNVTVTLDATLTDEERKAVRVVASVFPSETIATTLRSLLARLA